MIDSALEDKDNIQSFDSLYRVQMARGQSFIYKNYLLNLKKASQKNTYKKHYFPLAS